jgi:hypothetical protein
LGTVRLGIALERARAMEKAVRIQLAEELFDDLNLSNLPHNYSNLAKPTTPFDFDKLRKVILLDLPTAVRIFRERLQMTHPLDRRVVEEMLLDPYSTCRQDDIELYNRFLNEVQAPGR